MSTPLDLGFCSAKCMRALAAAGIVDIETLSAKSRLELLRIEGVGQRTLISIGRLLGRHGKSLRGGLEQNMGNDQLRRAFERVLSSRVANDLAQEIATDLICEVKYYGRGLTAKKNRSRFQPRFMSLAAELKPL